MNRKIRGVILIAVGLLMSVTAAVIFAKYEYQADIAGDNAEIVLEALKEDIRERVELENYDPAVREETASDLPTTSLRIQPAEHPEEKLAEDELVGILHVPAQELELPIWNGWNYDLLMVSPCRYSGSVEDGNLILLGHSYRRHFGLLKRLEIGDTVEFCDVNGKSYEYVVSATEILQRTELDALTSSDYDLTLFTCTNGGYSRYVVRCMRNYVFTEMGAYFLEK